MAELKSINNFNQQLEELKKEFIQKINNLKQQINNYHINSDFEINLIQRIGDNDEKYLEKCEGVVDQTIQSIQLNNLILEKENEIKEIIEQTNKKINELFIICKENKTELIMKIMKILIK